MTLAEYLTTLKNDTDYTYQEIAELSGLHINTVQNIINGKTKSTSMSKALSLVRALGGSPDILQKLDYIDGDPMAAEAQKIPTEPHALADYAMSIDTKMQYQAAILRERKLNRILCIALICTSVLLLILTIAIIALFTYDLTHPDRGWYQSFRQLTAYM